MELLFHSRPIYEKQIALENRYQLDKPRFKFSVPSKSLIKILFRD